MRKFYNKNNLDRVRGGHPVRTPLTKYWPASPPPTHKTDKVLASNKHIGTVKLLSTRLCSNITINDREL